MANGSDRTAWVPLLYFYLAALVGLIVAVVSSLLAVNLFVDMLTTQEYEAPNEGANFFKALLSTLIGAGVMYWHLREATRRERERKANAAPL